MVRGVWVSDTFWKCIKIRKHIRFCDNILIEVSVLVMRAKNEKYATSFMSFRGFGGGFEEGVWVIWRVEINNMWLRESFAIVSFEGWGFERFLKSDQKVWIFDIDNIQVGYVLKWEV